MQTPSSACTTAAPKERNDERRRFQAFPSRDHVAVLPRPPEAPRARGAGHRTDPQQGRRDALRQSVRQERALEAGLHELPQGGIWFPLQAHFTHPSYPPPLSAIEVDARARDDAQAPEEVAAKRTLTSERPRS